MDFILRLLSALAIIFTTVCSGPPPAASSSFRIDSNQAIRDLDGNTAERTLRAIHSKAWDRACEYTDFKKDEMPRFPYNAVHWPLTVETTPVDQDLHSGVWNTKLFRLGTARTYAWYQTDGYRLSDKSGLMPIGAHIRMNLTLEEIMQNRKITEDILCHEMIHYIHHYRVMNRKGWSRIWPGDGHNYMHYLKYIKGLNVVVAH